MKVSELIRLLKEIQMKHGDIVVTCTDLDRWPCDIEEVYYSTYPYENISIG